MGVMGTDGRGRALVSVREVTDGGLYPLSLRIVQECDARGLWPDLPRGGRLYARCLGLFLVIEAAESSSSVSPSALSQCVERLYSRALQEVSAEMKDYTRAEYGQCVEGFRSAFRRESPRFAIDRLVAEFCRRTQCDAAETIATLIDVSAALLSNATNFLRQYDAVLDRR
jgi:hypothetical protein